MESTSLTVLIQKLNPWLNKLARKLLTVCEVPIFGYYPNIYKGNDIEFKGGHSTPSPPTPLHSLFSGGSSMSLVSTHGQDIIPPSSHCSTSSEYSPKGDTDMKEHLGSDDMEHRKEKCIICLEDKVDEICVYPCYHLFCNECWVLWAEHCEKTKGRGWATCPDCRRIISYAE